MLQGERLGLEGRRIGLVMGLDGGEGIRRGARGRGLDREAGGRE